MVIVYAILKHDTYFYIYSTITQMLDADAQAMGKTCMEERLKQMYKIFMYFFAGTIPLCMYLHMVHIFYVNVINNSYFS